MQRLLLDGHPPGHASPAFRGSAPSGARNHKMDPTHHERAHLTLGQGWTVLEALCHVQSPLVELGGARLMAMMTQN